jgi:hypothetical protein
MIPKAQIRKQHRPIDLQRLVIDSRLVYQSLCACGRKAEPGSRQSTQVDQKAHRRELLSLCVR